MTRLPLHRRYCCCCCCCQVETFGYIYHTHAFSIEPPPNVCERFCSILLNCHRSIDRSFRVRKLWNQLRPLLSQPRNSGPTTPTSLFSLCFMLTTGLQWSYYPYFLVLFVLSADHCGLGSDLLYLLYEHENRGMHTNSTADCTRQSLREKVGVEP